MAKTRTVYLCQNCGHESSKWLGRCPSCGEWNTFTEQRLQKQTVSGGRQEAFRPAATPLAISEVQAEESGRLDMQNREFNRVLGGGLVPGSMVLIGGEPGIGKSTLALQVALELAANTLYISGEESPEQIRLRADRIGNAHGTCRIMAETRLQAIMDQLQSDRPDLLIVDSIQTLYSEDLESAPGTVSQVRDCAARLLREAKEQRMPVILIGHITKEGSIAGPKVLEHIVDTVLQFEGDSHHLYRILRASKNRFGSTSEIGVFEMSSQGLRQISNPSELLIHQQAEDLSGSAVAATVQGARPILLEIQALVSSAVYGTPQRNSTGFDTRRLNMLLAVLEKRASFKLASRDVFINVAGGLRVDDPGADLAVVAAILSSTVDIAVDRHTAFAGEVGLSGEIRPVARMEQRISEAHKLGMKRILVPAFAMKGLEGERARPEIISLKRVQDLPKLLFG